MYELPGDRSDAQRPVSENRRTPSQCRSSPSDIRAQNLFHGQLGQVFAGTVFEELRDLGLTEHVRYLIEVGIWAEDCDRSRYDAGGYRNPDFLRSWSQGTGPCFLPVLVIVKTRCTDAFY